jgi:hypothetical protein
MFASVGKTEEILERIMGQLSLLQYTPPGKGIALSLEQCIRFEANIKKMQINLRSKDYVCAKI